MNTASRNPLAFLLASLIAFTGASPCDAQQTPGAPGAPNKYDLMKERMNENTVAIVSGQTSGTYLKLAEDLQNVLDRRDTHEMRILPVTGTPGPQNLMDILFLRGVDMCMTETDYFDYFKALDPELYGNIEKKIHYIAKLYNTEFHIVAKQRGKQGRRVNKAGIFWGRAPGRDWSYIEPGNCRRREACPLHAQAEACHSA